MEIIRDVLGQQGYIILVIYRLLESVAAEVIECRCVRHVDVGVALFSALSTYPYYITVLQTHTVPIAAPIFNPLIYISTEYNDRVAFRNVQMADKRFAIQRKHIIDGSRFQPIPVVPLQLKRQSAVFYVFVVFRMIHALDSPYRVFL